MRLNEVGQHSWDVRVALDPHAGVADESATVLFEQYSSGLAFMLGFVGKADQLTEPTVVGIHGYGKGGLSAARAASDKGSIDRTGRTW